MAAMTAAKNKLNREAVGETEPTVKRVDQYRKRRKVVVPPELKGSRMGKAIKAKERTAPKVPKNKTLAEVLEMDPDDEGFKHKTTSRRTTGALTKEQLRSEEVDWLQAVRADKQRRFNGRRARARKGEATLVKAVEILDESQKTSKGKNRKGIFDEDVVIAEGILSLDDWDDEELIRGYRRERSGKFGQAPKFIPREVQQEIFRRIVTRGDKHMRGAYLGSIEALVDLAHGASSEKVKLEAIRELMNRVVGKVPDRVHVAQEQPWEAFLADSIEPIGDEWMPSAPVGEAVDTPDPKTTNPKALPSGADYSGKAPTEVQE